MSLLYSTGAESCNLPHWGRKLMILGGGHRGDSRSWVIFIYKTKSTLSGAAMNEWMWLEEAAALPWEMSDSSVQITCWLSGQRGRRVRLRTGSAGGRSCSWKAVECEKGNKLLRGEKTRLNRKPWVWMSCSRLIQMDEFVWHFQLIVNLLGCLTSWFVWRLCLWPLLDSSQSVPTIHRICKDCKLKTAN